MTNFELFSEQKYQTLPEKAIRDGFGDGLVAVGQQNPRVLAVCADLNESVRMQSFFAAHPDRSFQVGVAEQNMIGVASGLAREGYTVFTGSYAAFSPGRNHDQIRVSVCYANHDVKIVGGHAGLTVGQDGATHQALEDIALMRVLPQMEVYLPYDYDSAYQMTAWVSQTKRPAYLRLSRIASKNFGGFPTAGSFLRPLTPAAPIVFLATGILVSRALETALLLQKQGHAVAVWVLGQVKPLPDGLLPLLAQSSAVVTFEEHQRAGGVGSAVLEFMSQQSLRLPCQVIGVVDRFGESGQPEELLDAYGFAPNHLARSLDTWLRAIRSGSDGAPSPQLP